MSTLQTCTSGSRPTHGAGVIAYETDTTRTIISDGSDWHLYMPDLFSRATCAFSLRQIVPDYTGNCVKVRRSSDNGELDIGFTDTGVIDQTALLAHTGTGGTDTGYVVTWYDQGAYSMDGTNSTAAQQPTIVSAGAVVVSNSKPSILFGGNTVLKQSLYVNATQSTMVWKNEPPSPCSALAVCELTDVAVSVDHTLCGTFFGGYFNNYGDGIGASMNGGTMYFKRVSSTIGQVELWDTAALVNVTQAIAWYNFDGTTTGISTNGGSEQTTTTTPNPWSGGTTQNIGAISTGSDPWVGKISELAIYRVGRASEKTAILANVNGFYGTY
tara:strand:+ start:303 stop:1283 length:981 start_codon:yes stop_codon:yes gene_type:complete